MQKTKNYALNKPEITDFYNVEDFNANMDIIDEQLKTANDELAKTTKQAGENKAELTRKASVITQSTIIYVSTSGSDDNAGGLGTPLRTIQEAINRCPVITGRPSTENKEMHYTISVEAGTYNEALAIIGNKVTLTATGVVVLKSVSVSCAGQLTLNGNGEFHFSNAGANCVTLYNSRLYCFTTLRVSAGSIGIILAEGSHLICRVGVVDINNTTWSGIQLGDAGIGYIEELTGAGNTGAGIRCAKAVMWVAKNTLVTAGAPMAITDGGIVNTGTLNTTNKSLYGAVNELYATAILGTGRAYIHEKDDLNTYLTCGRYKCIVHGTAETLLNCPVKVAFTMDITSGTGEFSKIDTTVYSYIIQSIRTLDGETWYRMISSDPANGSISFEEWKKELSSADIVDNLESTDTDVPLSANQGRLLNESKAPSGYGLGGYGKLIDSTHDLNTLTGSGFYRWGDTIPANAPFTYGVMLQIDRGIGSVLQKVWQLGTGSATQISAERVVNDNVGEWEWVNPPIVLGVEYRTTERWNGKPVYVKLLDCGALPNSSTKYVSVADNCKVLRCSGYCVGGEDTIGLPFNVGTDYQINCHPQNQNIVLYSSYDSANYNAYVTAWYVKN